MRTATLLVRLGTLSLFLVLNSVLAQGTSFTYQGCLKASGTPANGSYDFRFRLSADELGNEYVGSPYLASGITVAEGLFTTTMDFGSGIFTGSNYWLEVAVRTNGTGAGYTILSPLQPVAPTPYAVFAESASNITGTVDPSHLPTTVITNGASSVTLSGVFSGDGRALTGVAMLAGGNTFSGTQIFTNGNIGIGTTKPDSRLVVNGTIAASSFTGDGAGLTNVFWPSKGDYLFAYADSGVESNGTYKAFKYIVQAGKNVTFNGRGASSDWPAGTSSAGQVFVAAHSGVYWVQYSVSDAYVQGGGFPHFQATLNGVRIAGSQCSPISPGNVTTSFIAAINAGDKLAIQCTPYAAQSLGTWNAGYFASLLILRIK